MTKLLQNIQQPVSGLWLTVTMYGKSNYLDNKDIELHQVQMHYSYPGKHE